MRTEGRRRAVPTRRASRWGESGYTLTELAIVMAIFMIFMGFAAPFMFTQIRSALRTEDNVELQQSGRLAFRTVVRELRQAKELYSTLEKPSGKNRISFGVDFNGDNVVNLYSDSSRPLEQVTYYVQNGVLYRGRRWNQGVPLAENVDSITFTMYGSNPALDTNNDGVVTESELNPPDGLGAWTPGELLNVTRITVQLTLSAGDETHTYREDAWLRNRAVG